jgi:hypothetical protein
MKLELQAVETLQTKVVPRWEFAGQYPVIIFTAGLTRIEFAAPVDPCYTR